MIEIKPKKILLLNMGGMGDIVMMSPVLKALKEKYKDAEISLLGITRTIETAENFKEIDNFYAFPMIWRLPAIKDIPRIISLLRALRSAKFDYLINLRDVGTWSGYIKMMFLTKVIDAGYSIGRSFFNYGQFYDKYINQDILSDKNDVELVLELLEPLGIKNVDAILHYPVKDEDEVFIEEELKKLSLSESVLIGFNPGAFMPSRRWPMNKWRKLAELIFERRKNTKIIITGSFGELQLAKQIKFSEDIIILNGRYSISQLAALYKKMNIMISNDSGPMHLAAAVGTKVVCVFGSGNVTRFTPSVSKDNYRVARIDDSELKCERPCYKFKCSNLLCFDLIKPEYVLNLSEELLGKL